MGFEPPGRFGKAEFPGNPYNHWSVEHVRGPREPDDFNALPGGEQR